MIQLLIDLVGSRRDNVKGLTGGGEEMKREEREEDPGEGKEVGRVVRCSSPCCPPQAMMLPLQLISLLCGDFGHG